MSLNRIDEGDFVRVYFPYGGGPILEGIVTYLPQAPGDCWHIRPVTRSGPNGWVNTCAVVYVQQFERMELEQKQLALPQDLEKLRLGENEA